ncbi:hypothetical protein FNF28_06009 [Cafeteria roenbergensis]|uniref:Uncharacterized protein n=1 Tax=Cafeteria roenbergensis TaxID=33653 RepID=A0A5A8D1C7_CAFRO|nr:hypothetical protein FNF28_06009 [Cafeteria roenbergensis]
MALSIAVPSAALPGTGSAPRLGMGRHGSVFARSSRAAVLHTLPSLASPRKTSSRLWRRLPQLVRAGDVLPRSEEVAKGVYRDYERDGKEYKDACTEARYFRPGKDCIVGKEADLHFDRVKKRYQLAHVWRSDIAGAVEGLEELRAEIEELALEAMMELGSDDESSDGMKAAATLVDEFIRACKGARYLAAATGFEGFLPGILARKTPFQHERVPAAPRPLDARAHGRSGSAHR